MGAPPRIRRLAERREDGPAIGRRHKQQQVSHKQIHKNNIFLKKRLYVEPCWPASPPTALLATRRWSWKETEQQSGRGSRSGEKTTATAGEYTYAYKRFFLSSRVLGFRVQPYTILFRDTLTHLCDLLAGYGGGGLQTWWGGTRIRTRTSCMRVRSVTVTLRGAASPIKDYSEKQIWFGISLCQGREGQTRSGGGGRKLDRRGRSECLIFLF